MASSSAAGTTTGAYVAREEALKREEEAGRLKFEVCINDGTDVNMIRLIDLKEVIANQLPNMPKTYIVRHVMDKSQKSMLVLVMGKVVGGTTYRPIRERKFGEVVFCAIAGEHQIKGYGTRLMNHLKQHVRDVDGLKYLLTFADNNAVGYFRKQGFTSELSLDRSVYEGYIKDYDGSTLMEFKLDPVIPYADVSTMVRLQRQALDERIRQLSMRHVVRPGINIERGRSGVPVNATNPADIPGLREAGWTPANYGQSGFQVRNPEMLHALMRVVVWAARDHPDAWPFLKPVNGAKVPDYYSVIPNPMDLETVDDRVRSKRYYLTLEMFLADLKRMFDNARTYNTPNTAYYNCAGRLEAFVKEQVRAELEIISDFNNIVEDDDDEFSLDSSGGGGSRSGSSGSGGTSGSSGLTSDASPAPKRRMIGE